MVFNPAISNNSIMDSRSRKYYQSRKESSGQTKGSANKGGYNEEHPENSRQPKENPGLSKSQDDPKADSLASQDDTGGSHSTGKRIDDN
jgi:hypothetical protein